MLPTQDTQHVTEAQAHLIEQFKYAPNIKALIQCYVASLQELENVFFDILLKRQLANATAAQLDVLGKIVGESRNGRSDTDYLPAIKLRIRVNRSQGRAEDIIQILQLAINATQVSYAEGPLLSFQADVTNISVAAANALFLLLPEAKEDGSRGALGVSYWPTSASVIFDSTTTVHPGGVTGFSSSYGGGGTYAFSDSRKII